MITRIEAARRILRYVKRLPVESLPVEDSLGFVLAKDVKSAIDLPPFDKSAMDGFAIARGDDCVEFDIVGEVAAGQVYSGKIRKGTAVRIMTGAPVPKGAGKVLMKEHVEPVGKGRIRLAVEDDRINICPRGEDMKKGTRLYTRGEVVTPIILANLVSSGIRKVGVYGKPRVGILTTGSELLKVGQKSRKGKIYNSNGPLLKSLLEWMGVDVVAERMVGDSSSGLKKAFSSLLSKSNVVFATGGVSVGEYDLVADVLKDVGCRIHFDRVAVQPGKPFTFATRGRKPIFAFPGNPVSVFASWFLFALPALYTMMGIDFEHRVCEVRFRGKFSRSRIERELFLPVRHVSDDVVEAVGYHGSGHLFALGEAEGLMVVPKGKGSVKDGEKVKVLPLSY